MNNKEKISIAEECGLIFQKIEDNEPQFVGTDEQFEEYKEELEFAEEGSKDGEEAKEDGLRSRFL